MTSKRIIPMRDAIREAMSEEMRRDENVFLMGEEVGAYNGAYKCSRGMLEEFGSKRVIDTPIAETGFSGVGVGAALTGLKPIIEFMTFNFSLVAIDQIINSAAKAHLMSPGSLKCPMVFRGANGGAFQSGAQHVNYLEGIYANTPGLVVIAPSTPYDTKGLLKSAIRNEDPVVFLEAELTYGLKGEVPEEEYLIPIGKADIKREGTDVTLISWSRSLFVTLQVAEKLAEQGINAEVLDIRTLRPLDKEAVLNSVAKTHRCIIIQDQYEIASYGAYLSHLIQREIFDELDAPVGLVSTMDVPMPYSKVLENYLRPNVENCLPEIEKILA